MSGENVRTIEEMRKALRLHLWETCYSFNRDQIWNGIDDIVNEFEASVKERLVELESRPIKSYWGDVMELRMILGESELSNSSTVKHDNTSSSKTLKEADSDGGERTEPISRKHGMERHGLEAPAENKMEHKRPAHGGGSVRKDKGMDEED